VALLNRILSSFAGAAPPPEKPWDAVFDSWIAEAHARGEDPNDAGDREWGNPVPYLERHYYPHLAPDKVVLELGPGSGRYTRHLISRVKKLILVDDSARVVEWLREYLRGKGDHEVFLAENCSLGFVADSSVDAVFASGFPTLPPGPRLALPLLLDLPRRMAPAQELFAATGGIHAAALFTADGELLLSREDVGRHNAVDKVVGALLLADRLPAGETVLAVSGRIGFEIVQKALRAGVPILVAVGAPSTLALRLAARAGMTVVGFVRDGRCNVYCGGERIIG